MNCKLGAIFCLSFRKQRRLNFDIIQEAVLFARLCGRIKPDTDANIQKKRKLGYFPWQSCKFYILQYLCIDGEYIGI